jgi:hypothetical protein
MITANGQWGEMALAEGSGYSLLRDFFTLQFLASFAPFALKKPNPN